ncbi:protein FAR1-RELATED SEQUENCE 5-like isoform X1 [Macadamia integrifolia]|uniref:protein FAR1-RELATED SEQUENCE 5-like isoform X1 n=1 Tax=Macadamia integrifolia TaxID=60698 RepID=UPI001C4EE362|nr:protein FAR1-RELATED SEQUENCE 5-like isoform X1 [Macadamia integrifolia]XP_042490704.1 protein FAR1-RELATED SEQUENCE 5-like isoform X1 [Macadamia integrifolia]
MECGSPDVGNDEEEHNCLDASEGNHDDVLADVENKNGDAVSKAREEDVMKSNENNDLCPCIGMEFESQDDAYAFYNRYAIEMGFSARKSSTRKSQRTSEIIGRCFCCSLQGYRNTSSIRPEDRKKIRQETRTGCKAMMSIRRKKGGRWVVSQVVKEHNHALTSPSKRHKLRSHRKIIEWEVLENMRSEGVGTNLLMNFLALENGGSCNASLTIRDVRNSLSTRRTKELRKGHIATILDYLERQQMDNPSFFHSIQVDSDGQVTNIFWADARSRLDYYYFGDVVCFDHTYGIDRYGIPFVPIVGINQHYQTVVLGGVLLFDETEESFAWVLATLVKAMGGQQPTIILTAEESAIGGAVEHMLPGTRHRFCLWNIMRNATKMLPHTFNARAGFARDFSNCLYQGETVEEFQSNWEIMLQRYDLRSNQWVMKLYENRERWAPIYTRDVFCAPMYTIQCIEGINAYFDGYLKRHTPLFEFLKQYDRAVLAHREAENDEDFENNQKKPVLRFGMSIEEEVAKVYTRTILQKFQDELVQALNYRHEKIVENGTKFTYCVWKREYEQARHTIVFDSSNNSVQCSCQLFEFAGYLCRHILKIFVVMDVQNIPSQYILKRWTREAKSGPLVANHVEEIQANCEDNMSLRYHILYRQANNIAAKASRTNEVYKVAIDFLHATLKEVEGALNNLSISSRELIKEVESTYNDKGNHGNLGNCLGGQNALLKPPTTKQKGRPGRKKSSGKQSNDKTNPKANMQVTERSVQQISLVGEESAIQRRNTKVGQNVETSVIVTNDHLESSIQATDVLSGHQTRNLVSPYIFPGSGSQTYSPCTSNLDYDPSSQASYMAAVQQSPVVMVGHQLRRLNEESSVASQQRQPLVIPRHDDIACNGFYAQQHSAASFIGHHQFGQGAVPAFVLNPHQLHGISSIDLNDPSQKGDGRPM